MPRWRATLFETRRHQYTRQLHFFHRPCADHSLVAGSNTKAKTPFEMTAWAWHGIAIPLGNSCFISVSFRFLSHSVITSGSDELRQSRCLGNCVRPLFHCFLASLPYSSSLTIQPQLRCENECEKAPRNQPAVLDVCTPQSRANHRQSPGLPPDICG